MKSGIDDKAKATKKVQNLVQLFIVVSPLEGDHKVGNYHSY